MRSNPEELLLGFIFALSGALGIFAKVKSTSLAAVLPVWMVRSTSAELLLAGLMICVGMFLRSRRVEIAGLLIMAFTCCAYSLAVLMFAGMKGLLTVLILGAYAAACASRAQGLLKLHSQMELAQRAQGADRV